MITVQTTTGTCKVGGDFNSALAQIKAISGREFDSQTRTWSVPLTAEELKKKLHFLPVDLPNGQHITRYGNRYERNEWQATQEAGKVRVEHTDARDDLRMWLKAELTKWIDASKVGVVGGLIEMAQLEDRIEYGSVQFSTPEKAAAITAINEEYWQRRHEIMVAEEDAEEAIKDRIYDKYGVK